MCSTCGCSEGNVQIEGHSHDHHAHDHHHHEHDNHSRPSSFITTTIIITVM
ncbi:hydrogenase nickel incorporation protein HypB [Morganella morganii]|nr:hydrogenase nickel incorporation protein HypB [Morganella morganii]